MIDTVKFAIPYSEELIEAINKIGTNVVTQYNSATGVTKFKVARGDTPLGSYDRNVNLFINEPYRKISIELSLPKFMFGHNVFMLYPQEVESTLYKLWANLNYVYKYEFPCIDTWELIRLDLCYSWRFPTQENAQSMLNLLKHANYPHKRKTKQSYDTGVFHGGKDQLHSIKFYLKQPEFYVHDYKALKANPNTIEMAYQFHTWSAGILRFEVSLKRPYLLKEFPHYKGKYHIATQYGKISELLGEFLSDYLKFVDKSFMTITDASSKLRLLHSPSFASQLLSFWEQMNRYDWNFLTDVMYKDVNRSSLYRWVDSLKKAELGLFSTDDSLQSYSISIPSEFSTNPPLLATSEDAEASRWETA